jgi:hypothetical protein
LVFPGEGRRQKMTSIKIQARDQVEAARELAAAARQVTSLSAG